MLPLEFKLSRKNKIPIFYIQPLHWILLLPSVLQTCLSSEVILPLQPSQEVIVFLLWWAWNKCPPQSSLPVSEEVPFSSLNLPDLWCKYFFFSFQRSNKHVLLKYIYFLMKYLIKVCLIYMVQVYSKAIELYIDICLYIYIYSFCRFFSILVVM